MNAGSASRRLAAIVALDVVAYSKLMGLDESGTHARLKAHRKDFIEPLIEEHEGRVVKLTGDGALVEFPSAVQAVLCASTVQRGMAERNTDQPAEQRIDFRIGINIGDIIIDEGDIYGDGVNIAARLEGLAEPGGICIARNVYDQVKSKVELGFQAMGSHQVKNIAEPISVYRVELDDKAPALVTPIVQPEANAHRRWQPVAAVAALLLILIGGGTLWWRPWISELRPASVERMALELPDKPSIAILPFDNMSGDPEQEYFADGLTEDLITDMSKVSGLFIIARNSSFTYKDKPTKVQQVAEDLGVRYVVEGSVRRVGDEVRINAQLIDAIGGHHLWAERYDGSMTDVFALQDSVISEIVSALAVTLTSDERARALGPETEVVEAYDTFLRGWEAYRLETYEGLTKAEAHFKEAIQLDPKFGRAHAALAVTNWKQISLSWDFHAGTQWEHTRQRGIATLAKALEYSNPLAYAVSAEVHALEGRPDESLTAIAQATSLAPSDAENFLSKGLVLNILGRAEDAENAVRTAMRLDPHYRPEHLRVLAQSLLHQQRYEEAAEMGERILTRRQEFPDDYQTLVSIYGHLGRFEDAAAAAAKYDEAYAAIGKTTPISVQEASYWWYADMYDYDPEYREHFLDGMRKAGIREGTGSDIAYGEYRSLISKDKGVYSVEGATRIDAGVAKSLHERDVAIVDVRGFGFDHGHIPGAHHLDLNDKLNNENLSRLVAKDEEVVLHCAGEHCPWAAYASAKAVLWGFTQVYYFAGGFPEWKDAGYDVATGSES